MTITQAIVLGAVQGVTEFLPISSSGFLILISEAFGWNVQSLGFDAFLHVATLIAVVVALWPDIRLLLRSFFVDTNTKDSRQWQKIALWIVLATIPVVVVGFILQNIFQIEFRSIEIVAWSFIVWGAVLYLSDRFAKQQDKELKKITLRQSLFVGCAQAIALIPGTSRSGITVTAGLLMGQSRELAARFSFLLAIPTIAAAAFLKLEQVAKGTETIELLPLSIGFFVALVTAFLTIKFFLQFLQKYTLAEFAIFRVIVGVAILLLG